jgi:hypothetical protein
MFLFYAITKEQFRQEIGRQQLKYESYSSWLTFDYVLDNIEYVIPSLLLAIVISVEVVRVNREKITKELYLISFVLKSKTWREIKYYIEVDEIYDGGGGKSTTKAIWFVGNNNKVCLRFKKSFRNNLHTVLNTIDKFETKNNNKLTIANPYFMKRGWTTVKLPELKL